jgi:dienelactone hydrolase
MSATQMSVEIVLDEVSLEGDLALPEQPAGVVLFAHGSGSSRHSPRNRHVAERLRHAGLGTLLTDLLTEREEEIDQVTAELRFDIGLLAERLVGAIDWLVRAPETAELPIGLFGASTGAAAALVAAAERPEVVHAVVSRGGRPDLAADALPRVESPTLLIVGGADSEVLALNREAAERLEVTHEIEVVRHATHLFEEPGALDQVAALAARWFERFLAPATSRPGTRSG